MMTTEDEGEINNDKSLQSQSQNRAGMPKINLGFIEKIINQNQKEPAQKSSKRTNKKVEQSGKGKSQSPKPKESSASSFKPFVFGKATKEGKTTAVAFASNLQRPSYTPITKKEEDDQLIPEKTKSHINNTVKATNFDSLVVAGLK